MANAIPRTVITGLGVVSPVGIGNEAFWSALTSGASGVGFLEAIPSDKLPTKLAAEINDFDQAVRTVADVATSVSKPLT